MGRDEHHKNKGRQKRKLPQTPNNQKNIDVEFSEELADREDKIAQERAKAADRRAHKRQ